MTIRKVQTAPAQVVKRKILVCDDEVRRQRDWAKKIERVVGDVYDVRWANPEEVGSWIAALDARRQTSRELADASAPCARGTHDLAAVGSTGFDDAAIAFIDYDLGRFHRPMLDGESLAYLVRCYSSCGIIVALNRYGSAATAFDLTLRGHPESYADFGMGSDHIAEPGLWGINKRGFCPWAWPVLPDAIADYEQCVDDLTKRDALGGSILEFFGFDPKTIESMPRGALEFLARHGDPHNVTFKDFVDDSGNGLRGKDATTETQKHRIGAARIRKWLNRCILARQDILVDAPHLVGRFGSLAPGGRVSEIDGITWKRLGPHDLDKKLARHAFSKRHWLSRSAWFWAKVRNDESINEISQPWNYPQVSDVFCEDVSRFVPRSSSREFVADVGSAFVRRFVVNPGDKKWGAWVRGVQYEPTVRFWMAS